MCHFPLNLQTILSNIFERVLAQSEVPCLYLSAPTATEKFCPFSKYESFLKMQNLQNFNALNSYIKKFMYIFTKRINY